MSKEDKAKCVDPRVRVVIARWPQDAPRGAVTTFCQEHGISRKTFYVLRKRALEEGEAAVLQPRSRRPVSSPTRISDEITAQAVQVRQALQASGLDGGPISVHDKMKQMGLPAPSPASLARIFRDAGVARRNPRKRPRSAFHRFTYPAPNACWQLDSTEYTLRSGRVVVIFQLQDDHSRLAVASLVAEGETAQAAIKVFDKAVAARGVPQRLLTDNAPALNPSRMNRVGKLVTHVTAMGVEAITGRPYKPTTQGKNERFHQTLQQWLARHPTAATIDQLQAMVDTFDHIYNTQRPHQALEGRMTPQQAWDATTPATPPHPRPDDDPIDALVEAVTPPRPPKQRVRKPIPATGERPLTLSANGTVNLHGVTFNLTKRHAHATLTAIWTRFSVEFIHTTTGEVIAEIEWPAPTLRYASIYTHSVTHVLTQETSPMS